MIEEFARCGVRHAAVSPGSRSTPLAVALWRQPAIDVQVVLDERSAAFFALGTALSTRVPAVALCTSGSAAAHFHPAVAEADEASVPLIVLTADRPPELRGIGAGQTIDQLKLYGDAARWFSELGNHEADDDGLLHFRSTACRAYAASAGEPRPGPVHLNVPFRDPLAPVPVEGAVTATDPLALEGRGERPLSAVARTPQAPDPALLDELAARIASVPRGLVLAGRQPDQELAEPLCALADAAGYPVLAEPTSQLRWGPQPHSMSVPGYDLIARARPDQLEPALVLRFGDMPTSKALRQWLAAIAGLRQIVVDPAGDWKEPTRRAEMLLRADPATLAAGLTERLKAGAEARRTTPAQASGETGGAPAWLERWLDAQRRLAAGVGDELARLEEASEPGVWPALAAVLRDGDNVLAASSMPVRDQETFIPPGRARVRFVSNRGANGIDGLVSTAAGVARGSGGRTWAVLGDLALAHDLGGLATAARVPGVRLIVLDNGGGGIFHFLPQAEELPPDEFEHLLGTPSGLDLEAAFGLFGIEAVRVESSSSLSDALAADARAIVVTLDRRRNLELHQRIADRAALALNRA
ncbi:MAG: 2-succinyl-6-hydroxy-2,4-cyclohexadiene-carboxylic acid synthase/2-oxoglutarate decarboxylase [Solirubrobacterales bacterium]|jgi:2-succinyl-5-enolpyruvyl-6-hydroxy-3-cyclohexene-1-carboxylate synthase|nr:2-succinyl-6-hydroxy-2,4-cyclohexadiene-carboxylic acid synthase/2-oxoglutarate decarboxylase [Solirubrobacterales bacterium]